MKLFVTEVLIFRSSRSQMFFKICVLKNFAIFTGKHWSLHAFFYFFFSWIWYLLPTVAPVFAPTLWKHKLKVRSSHWNSSVKKGVLKNFASFSGKQLCWSLFLKELQTFRPAALLKRDSNIDVFLWNLQNF